MVFVVDIGLVSSMNGKYCIFFSHTNSLNIVAGPRLTFSLPTILGQAAHRGRVLTMPQLQPNLWKVLGNFSGPESYPGLLAGRLLSSSMFLPTELRQTLPLDHLAAILLLLPPHQDAQDAPEPINPLVALAPPPAAPMSTTEASPHLRRCPAFPKG